MTETNPSPEMLSKPANRPNWPGDDRANPPYFNGQGLIPDMVYVAWIDLMGANNAMRLSLQRAANFIAKIHVAGLEAKAFFYTLNIYPVIDGFYAVTSDQSVMLGFLRLLMRKLATLFLNEKSHEHQFFVRCGLAYGPIILGQRLASGSE